MVGRNGSEREKGAKWGNGSASRHRPLALAAARTCCLSLLLRGKGDIFWAKGLVGGVSSTGEAATSWRTSWAVRGKRADTGDLNGLESFSLHRVIWMPGEPLEGVLGRRDVIGEHGEWEMV